MGKSISIIYLEAWLADQNGFYKGVGR